MDQFTGIPIGLWLGAAGVLLVGMAPAIAGTLLAGTLMQRKPGFASIVLPYMEIMGTASLACLFLVVNTVGRWAGLPIIAPPPQYQVPLYGFLLLTSFAAFRVWRPPVRGALHVAWMITFVFYGREILRTEDAFPGGHRSRGRRSFGGCRNSSRTAHAKPAFGGFCTLQYGRLAS